MTNISWIKRFWAAVVCACLFMDANAAVTGYRVGRFLRLSGITCALTGASAAAPDTRAPGPVSLLQNPAITVISTPGRLADHPNALNALFSGFRLVEGSALSVSAGEQMLPTPLQHNQGAPLQAAHPLQASPAVRLLTTRLFLGSVAASVAALAVTATTGAKRMRKIHIKSLPFTLVSLVATLILAERTGRIYSFSDLSSSVHMPIAYLTAGALLLPIVTGLLYVSGRIKRITHGWAAIAFLGMVALAAASGGWMMWTGVPK